jgi:hypothetical protein
MPSTPFTARTLEALKPKPHRYSVYDPDCPGLVLRVTPAGVKTWSFVYRVGDKQKRLTFGAYGPAPALTLAEARTRARRARVQVDDGHDPAAQKLEAREAARRDTFGKLAELYLEKHAKRQKRSWTEDERILKRDLLPAWEDVPVKALTRRMVREHLDAIADRAPVMANRTLALVSKIFNFGVDREWLDANPAARLKKPTREVSRERVLTDDEIATLWANLKASDARYAREGRRRVAAQAHACRLAAAAPADGPAWRRDHPHDVGRRRLDSQALDDPVRRREEQGGTRRPAGRRRRRHS